MSKIALMGLSHKTAPVQVREKLALESGAFARWLKEESAVLGLDGFAVVSTCNRLEIYLSAGEPAPLLVVLRKWLEERVGARLETFFYSHAGFAAIRHLFRVASGLDSMVVGETEILRQVKTAYQTAVEGGAADRGVHLLFQKALAVGKKVRARTRISEGATSVGGAAVLLAERIFGDLGEKSVLVLGAGKMAEAAVRHLLSKKVRKLFIANRTYEKASELAGELSGEALPWSEGLKALAEVDIVLCSTSSPLYVLTRDRLREDLKTRRSRPLFLVDISVPRNVDPAAAGLEGVYLYDIDDLQNVLSDRQVTLGADIARAGEIVDREAGELQARFDRTPPPDGQPAGVPAARTWKALPCT